MLHCLLQFHGRALTYGEIGCFLSHYKVWQQVVASNLDTVLVLEDDIRCSVTGTHRRHSRVLYRFEPYFTGKLEELLEELREIPEQWDLVFLGRKILHNAKEDWLEGSRYENNEQHRRDDHNLVAAAWCGLTTPTGPSPTSSPGGERRNCWLQNPSLSESGQPGVVVDWAAVLQDGAGGRVPAHHVRPPPQLQLGRAVPRQGPPRSQAAHSNSAQQHHCLLGCSVLTVFL